MDAETRQEWKWQFYRLALHLNVVVILIALTVMAVLKAPEAYRTGATAILFILTVISVITFNRRYHAAKAWLDEHGTVKKSE